VTFFQETGIMEYLKMAIFTELGKMEYLREANSKEYGNLVLINVDIKNKRLYEKV
jgi:hypothetical protein